MRKILIASIGLSLIFIFSGCETKIDKQQEKFAPFFKEFKQKKEFQFSRTKYPLEYWQYTDGIEPSDYKYVQSFIPKSKKRFNDFQFNNSNEKVVINNDTVVVQIRGMDSGLYIDYYFTKNEAKWYLVKVENTSN